MALYYFKGRNALDRIVEGHVHAESSLEVTRYLNDDHITPIVIEQKRASQRLMTFLCRLFLMFIPIGRQTVSTFYYQVAGMLSVDVPIKSAIHIVSGHMMNRRMASILTQVEQRITKGVPLAQAMSSFKRVFGRQFIQLMGLAGSRLELVSVFQFGDKVLSRSAFVQRAFYLLLPGLSFLMMFVLLLLFLEHRYLPDFYFSLSTFNKAVPQSIQYFEYFIAAVTHQSWLLLPIVFFSLILLRFVITSFAVTRQIYHTILFYLPVVGPYVCALERERLALIVSLMLQGGATVQRCLEYGIKVVDNRHFHQRVLAALQMLHRGDSFSDAMLKCRLFGAAETQMLVLGEAAGNLKNTFSRVHSVCELLMERRIHLFIEGLRFVVLMLNLFAFLSLVIITETIFFYPSA